jgi:hypothetical protein
MLRWDEFQGGTPRAPRFPLDFALSYRVVDDTVWRGGRGTNISRSGLMFLAEQPVPIEARLEVSFSMPVRLPGRIAATVVCRGRIVRQTITPASDLFHVAATIDSYRFLRAQRAG